MKGIIYSAPMVLAILEDHKDITRRPMKPQPIMERGVWRWGYATKDSIDINLTDNADLAVIFAPYKVGETVYCKETWWEQSGDLYYKADWPSGNPINFDCDGGKWRSPRFMPEWASRIHQKVLSVRCERLQEIGEEEAIREGMRIAFPQWESKTAREIYSLYWDVLYGAGSWGKNPWVFRYEIQRVKG